MECRKSDYIALCFQFFKGNYGDLVPEDLDAATAELLLDNPPAEVAKLQMQGLKQAFTANPHDFQCLDRFCLLIDKFYAHHTNFIKEREALAQQAERVSGSKMSIPALMQHLEESHYMINKLAEITETLDNKVCQLLPYQMQLLELQQISHTIIQNAYFGVLVVDQSSQVKMFNKSASKILSIPENIVGQTLEQALKETQGNYDFLFKALSGKSSHIEVEIQGEKKVLEISSNNLTGQTGETEGVVILINDITAREEEKKVLEENIKLAAIGKLAAGVTHEIKNPLTVIKGFSQLLAQKNYDDPQVGKYLELICKEADRANSFIQDFLKLGRRQQPRKKAIDVSVIIADIIALIESHCFLNGIEIKQQLDCSCKILADPDQIKQVLINLIKNSMEAMEGPLPKKTLTIAISQDEEEQLLVISVKDTGSGIPQELLEKVSTPFFTTKRFGTGLGLNISKNIIEHHGGQLKFASGPEGTTVTIELPLINQQWEEETAPFARGL
ncbi:MAG TPA: GHKL domain-containing protein [Clostridia bacterium]|nr:GHKL domain-containing protein [Clostridia bacterium]